MRTIEERWRWVAWAWKTSIKQARRRTRATLYDSCMLIVHVHIHVKPESVEAFRQATIANARQSVKEAGIARFDVLQQADAPTRFILVEVYRTAEAPAQHRETAHPQKNTGERGGGRR